jgi:hypothetical protein
VSLAKFSHFFRNRSHDTGVALGIDPQDDVRKMTVNAIQVLSNSYLGNIAGPVISDDILDILGLGSTSEIAAYLSRIEQQLDQIQGEIEQLQQSVNAILAGITEIKDQIADVEIQAKLQDFAEQSDAVKQHFSLYADAIMGLASGDKDKIQSSANDLFDLLSLDNLDRIATAMTNIQEIYSPSLSEAKSLIDMQTGLVTKAIRDYASNPENYLRLPNGNLQILTGWTEGQPQPTPTTSHVSSCSYIVDHGHIEADSTLTSVVADVFKAFITVELQGLILLSMGWLSSIHEPQIPAQISGIQRILREMTAFEPAVLQAIDREVSDCLHSFGQPLTGYAAGGDQTWVDCRKGPSTNPLGDTGYPFSNDWIMWLIDSYQEVLYLAHQPWTFKQEEMVRLSDGGWIFQGPWLQKYPININAGPLELSGNNPTFTVKAAAYPGVPTGLQFIRGLALNSN